MSNNEMIYQNSLQRLRQKNKECQAYYLEELMHQINKLHHSALKIGDDDSIAMLNNILEKTIDLFDNPSLAKFEQYQELAKTVPGSSSVGKKTLGALMSGLLATAFVLLLVAFPTIMGALMMGTLGVILVVGAYDLITRPQGLSETMNHVAHFERERVELNHRSTFFKQRELETINSDESLLNYKIP